MKHTVPILLVPKKSAKFLQKLSKNSQNIFQKRSPRADSWSPPMYLTTCQISFFSGKVHREPQFTQIHPPLLRHSSSTEIAINIWFSPNTWKFFPVCIVLRNFKIRKIFRTKSGEMTSHNGLKSIISTKKYWNDLIFRQELDIHKRNILSKNCVKIFT